MKVEMRKEKHLWITIGDPSTKMAEVIIDLENGDIRINDFRNSIVKVRLNPDLSLKDILKNDVLIVGCQPR